MVLANTPDAFMFLVVLLKRDRYENSCSISSPAPNAAPSCHLPPQRIYKHTIAK